MEKQKVGVIRMAWENISIIFDKGLVDMQN